MASINNFDDWILEDIFTMLSREDRLICKVVSKRWYNILMDRPTFWEDRRIYFKTSEIIAPMTVFMEAQKRYETYIINNDTHGRRNSDLLRFFKCVGSSVEKLIYTGDHCNFFDILKILPNLQFLVLPHMDLREVEWIFSRLKCKNFKFHYLEIGRFRLFVPRYGLNDVLNNISNIKHNLPQICNIALSYANIDKIESLGQLLENVKKIKEIFIDIQFKPEQELEKLLEINDMKCNILRLSCSSQHRPFQILEELQNKHKNLKEIKLTCMCLPPVGVNFPKITKLDLKLHALNGNLKSLETLPNLEVLNLNMEGIDCGFGHELIVLPKLRDLDISVKSMCNECSHALSNSFEKLVKFSFETKDKITWIPLKVLTRKWAKNLTLLRVSDISNLSTRTLKKMSNAFPNLELLMLSTKEHIFKNPLSERVKAALPAFQKLTNFTYYNSDDPYDYKDCTTGKPIPDKDIEKMESEEFETICKYLESIGIPIVDEHSAKDDFKMNEINIMIDRQKMTSQIKER